MKRNLYVLISLIALASMILAACGAKPTEAPAVAATEAPVVQPKLLRLARLLAEPIPFPMAARL